MKLAVFGHRPQKLGGFTNHKAHKRVKKLIEERISKHEPDVVYVGMSLGVPMWTAEICAKHKIPFIAAIPFKGHDLKWPQHLRDHYNALLRKAAQVIEVDREHGYISGMVAPGTYSAMKMKMRNNWIVDQLQEDDVLLAITTNEYRFCSGITYTIRYAEQNSSCTSDVTLVNVREPRHQVDPLEDLPF
jgi:uncharacterized phage-like protein YoqJ